VAQRLVLILLAGALGTLARYGAGLGAQRLFGTAFPWGTWFVNASGCFLFGLIYTLAEERALIPQAWRIILLTGFMGAYTTFSSYIFEASQLMQTQQWALLAATFLGENALGFGLLLAGFAVGRMF
jgi:CrcB protein